MAREANLVVQDRLIREELERFLHCEKVGSAAAPNGVHALLDFIHQNLFDPILNVSAIKSACHEKNNNVSTRFKRSMGVGLRQYLEHKRLAAAARLLEQEELQVFLIGSAVGYAHEESFTRAFRRHFGCTPTAFRQKLDKKRG